MCTFYRLRATNLFLIIFLLFGKTWGYRCDYDYKLEDGWMKLHKIPEKWEQANLKCQLEGAVLASPVSLRHAEAMIDLMSSKKLQYPVHTDITAMYSKGDFTSSDGVPLSKIPHTWADGEPNNVDDQESCIVLKQDNTIADAKCSSVYPYICYKNKSEVQFENECGFDPEYMFDSRTGSCYKLHTTPRRWSEAFKACMAEEGHLAIINSESESLIIMEIFGNTRITADILRDVAFLGFRDINEGNGNWRTVHGQTLKEAGFDRFSPGEPHNARNEGRFCGAVNRDGLFNALYCAYTITFFCEKPPRVPCNSTLYKNYD